MMGTSISLLDETFTLDEFGFLDPPGQWSEVFALGMAERLGIVEGLSDDHWRIIHSIRNKYQNERTVSFFVEACRANGLRIREFRDLFPTGYLRGACRLAGLSFEFILSQSEAHTLESSPPSPSRYGVNVLGFLEDFEQWDERFARAAARSQKLAGGVTDRRLEFLRYLRGYFARNRCVPPVSVACRANGLGLREMRRLFPSGYRDGACLMAGLPYRF